MKLGARLKQLAWPDRYAFLAALLGGLAVLGFAPFEFSPLALISLAGLFWLWGCSTSRSQAFKYGLWFGLGQFGVGASWLFSSIYFYSEIGLIGSVVMVAGFVILLALFPALAGALGRYFYNPNRIGASLLWVFPAAWVLLEWVRSSILGGLPFMLMGMSHLGTWLDGYATVFGVLGVSFVVAVTAGLMVWFVQHKQTLPAALLVAFIWPIGGVLQKTQWVTPVDEPIEVALLQGNFSQDQKWQSEQFVPMMRRYVGMTRANLDADLIVWPETAIPGYFDRAADTVLSQFIADAQLQSRDIMVGTITREADNSRYYNAMVNLRDLEQEYRKRHLVMFGEYYPLSGVVEKLAQSFGFPFSQFSAADQPQKPLTLGGQPAGVSICFEMMFGSELAQDLPHAKYFVTTSNDAWFAHTFEPAQLLQEAQMRARELGREIARATNTGHTAIIGVDGQIKTRIPAYEAGVLRGQVQPYEGLTPYARWTNWPILMIVFGIFGFILGKRYAYTGKISNPFNRKK